MEIRVFTPLRLTTNDSESTLQSFSARNIVRNGISSPLGERQVQLQSLAGICFNPPPPHGERRSWRPSDGRRKNSAGAARAHSTIPALYKWFPGGDPARFGEDSYGAGLSESLIPPPVEEKAAISAGGAHADYSR